MPPEAVQHRRAARHDLHVPAPGEQHGRRGPAWALEEAPPWVAKKSRGGCQPCPTQADLSQAQAIGLERADLDAPRTLSQRASEWRERRAAHRAAFAAGR